jgi:Cd2+/Zn2+-exporting ATPase
MAETIIVAAFDPDAVTPVALKEAPEQTGFAAAEVRDDDVPDQTEDQRLQVIRVVVVGTLLGSAWVISLLALAPLWLVDTLAGLAAVVGGYRIAAKAIRSALHRQISIDALVAIAALAALATGDYLEASLVVFILLLGELLEEITVSKTGEAIQALASLVPNTANVKRGDVEVEVAISEIAIGDVVVVRPGERIAVDGIVLAGKAAIDQAPITGESLPVEKAPGDEVYSGTINHVGAIEIRATKVGKDTTVAKIRTMIAEAQSNKAQVERLVDRYATYFVPAMLLVATIVYLVTGDVRRAITVLIVACPCAFVLGTPTAVVAAIGAAARQGIVIRGGKVVELLGKVSGVVFDKTGTLTCGTPQVVDVRQICGHGDRDVLRFAAVAEKLSEHPLANAILEKAREWELDISTPDDFRVMRGLGVEAHYAGLHIVLGNRELLAQNVIGLPTAADEYMRERESRGETTLIVAHDKEVCGLISLADPVRTEASQAIRRLKSSGTHRIIAMYTGDNHRTAAAIADSLGVEEVAAEMLPEDKVNRINTLKRDGHAVAMVGDGINDAPALATADIGIAMGVVGSDVAMQAANVVLLSENLLHIPLAISLGRKTLTVIQQNLIFALVFNTAMVILASGGIVSMVVGAICHQGSSLLVILNSMRLLLAVREKSTREERVSRTAHNPLWASDDTSCERR